MSRRLQRPAFLGFRFVANPSTQSLNPNKPSPLSLAILPASALQMPTVASCSVESVDPLDVQTPERRVRPRLQQTFTATEQQHFRQHAASASCHDKCSVCLEGCFSLSGFQGFALPLVSGRKDGHVPEAPSEHDSPWSRRYKSWFFDCVHPPGDTPQLLLQQAVHLIP